MRKILTLIFSTIALFSQAQQIQDITYTLDMIQPDSFYLVETITYVATKEQPRPNNQVNNILMRDTAQVGALITGLKADGKKAADLAAQYTANSQILNYKAAKLDELKKTSKWFDKPKAAIADKKP